MGARVSAGWNQKAADWVKGRKEVFRDLQQFPRNGRKTIWMHCASAGEFEQGKPLLSEFKRIYPDHFILVSFFSPSGYRAGKKFKDADQVCYLPEDNRRNARRFVDIVQPSLVVLVKYDYWYFHLKEIDQRKIPLILISAIFRPSQAFFQWYGALHRTMLRFFNRLFVQDDGSKQLLNEIDINHVTVAGDTRFDRVAEIASRAVSIPVVASFAEGRDTIIAGSTWPEDENLLIEACRSSAYNLVLVPHEINEAAIRKQVEKWPDAIRFSEASNDTVKRKKILIIDNYGMLSSLYQYATLCYVGGGFNASGIHNTLEAAVWGKPVVFGPNYQKFREARELVATGAAWSVKTSTDLKSLLNRPHEFENAGRKAGDYIDSNKGAVQKIMNYIQENRLLTT
jgi:3-deoxy-D-manno-octulosonic-acid transferase